MAGKIVLAVAGAGKTYYICNNLDENKRNLILAFTHENIHNIYDNLNKIYGCIPHNTIICTFDSFVYNQIILPFESYIIGKFNISNFQSKGVTLSTPPPRTIKKNNKQVPNFNYKKKEDFSHYNKDGYYYCDTLSELAVYKAIKKDLITKVSRRLTLFFDHIYVDEFQDFRLFNYDLLIELSKKLDMTLVGDYYQHSVSGKNNYGRPFDKEISYSAYINLMEKKKFTVETNLLNNSRRCSSEVCDFVRKKLGIDIYANNEHLGKVKFVSGNNINRILDDDSVIKLVYKNSKLYKFRSCNWSYSKGDTFDKTCVILTDKLKNLDSENFNPAKLGQINRNKLYVALTRSKGDVYLIKVEDFNKVREDYISNH